MNDTTGTEAKWAKKKERSEYIYIKRLKLIKDDSYFLKKQSDRSNLQPHLKPYCL